MDTKQHPGKNIFWGPKERNHMDRHRGRFSRSDKIFCYKFLTYYSPSQYHPLPSSDVDSEIADDSSNAEEYTKEIF